MIDQSHGGAEWRFVAHACRGVLNPSRGDAATPPSDLDWGQVRDCAQKHRVMPLVYRYCKEAGIADAVERLERLFLMNAARNEVLGVEIHKLLSLLEAAGIDAALMKGPALAVRAYGDLALRQFDDLDLLMAPTDVLKAQNILLAHGYRKEIPLSGPAERAFVRAGWDTGLTNDKGCRVELCTGLGARHLSLPLAAAELMAQPAAVEIGGQEVRSVASGVDLLLIAVHGAKHGFARLAWIADIAWLVKTTSGDWDWGQVLQRSRKVGCLRMVLLGLALAREVLGLALSEDVEREIERDRYLAELVGWTIQSLQGQVPAIEGRVTDTLRYHLRSRERARDRYLYVLRWLFTPSYSDWMSVKFPEKLFFLYYLTRPFRLLARLCRRK